MKWLWYVLGALLLLLLLAWLLGWLGGDDVEETVTDEAVVIEEPAEAGEEAVVIEEAD